MLRLNLGAGARPKEGYINSDVMDWANKGLEIMDALALSYGDGTVDEIFNHALLEHIPPWDTLRALREWHRALKSGGIVQVEVPDLERIFRAWLLDGTLSEKSALDNIFGGNKNPRKSWQQHHLTGFTFERLARLMEEAGFIDLERVETNIYIILAVRGRKPT